MGRMDAVVTDATGKTFLRTAKALAMTFDRQTMAEASFHPSGAGIVVSVPYADLGKVQEFIGNLETLDGVRVEWRSGR